LPPPPPCNPPPHEISSRTRNNAKLPAMLRPSLGLVRAKENNPAIGNTNMNMERVASAALGTGAVVAIVRATTESPLPEPTCGGLKLHVVNAGSLEHEKVTLFGKLPVVGFTSMLKLPGCPAGTEVLGGVMPMVKSKFWLGIAVNMTDAECVISEGSLPTPVTTKAYACVPLLETVTLNGVPLDTGVAFAGLITQLGGFPVPHASVTELV